ncbi:GNAT family N-acetyltransferase [Paenibacillus sp. EC2-1]|uniref:GNAT family N-acetyltransferase n=1 Tax=Paenibacillus sp. EC2-1 TaxID=3388665 RepID=UPI003BEEB221
MMISKVENSDLKEILELQYRAYRSEAEIYNDYTIQPLVQTMDELEFEHENLVILKATENNKIIGSVRVSEENDVYKIGKLIVDPSVQNQGVGTKLMQYVEQYFNHVQRFELFTGHRSERNLYLYKKLGYRPFKQEEITKDLILISMYKDIHEAEIS